MASRSAGSSTRGYDVPGRNTARAGEASAPRERSEPAKRRARARVGESEGRSPSDKEGAEMNSESTLMEPRRVVDDVVRRRAEAEYLEMPGLKLTAQQASRLWHLDASASAQLLDSMVDAGVLYRARDGAYVLLSAR